MLLQQPAGHKIVRSRGHRIFQGLKRRYVSVVVEKQRSIPAGRKLYGIVSTPQFALPCTDPRGGTAPARHSACVDRAGGECSQTAKGQQQHKEPAKKSSHRLKASFSVQS